MAHQTQFDFILQCKSRFPTHFASNLVVEIGSQNINGTVRDLFNSEYLGIDIGQGKDVDFVCAGDLLQLPTSHSDVTLSTECFEHASNWKAVLHNMIRITKPNGLVMLTFAGRGRPAHGTRDSDAGASPFTLDHYKNVTASDLISAISLDYFFDNWSIETNNAVSDTYFWGIRSHREFRETTEVQELEHMLSRARGQLSQAARTIIEKNQIIAEREKEVAQHKNPLGYILNKILKTLRP